MRNGMEFVLVDVEGEDHTIVIKAGMETSEGSRAAPMNLLYWRRRVFGSRHTLTELAKKGIKFNIEDQVHWFSKDKKWIILTPKNHVHVVDINKKVYRISISKNLPRNKMSAYLYWKTWLCKVARVLMHVEQLASAYHIQPNPTWSLYDAKPIAQPVSLRRPIDAQEGSFSLDYVDGQTFDQYEQEEVASAERLDVVEIAPGEDDSLDSIDQGMARLGEGADAE